MSPVARVRNFCQLRVNYDPDQSSMRFRPKVGSLSGEGWLDWFRIDTDTR